VRIELGAPRPGWLTARACFASTEAVDGFLAHERALYPGADLKSYAAFMMRDYLSIFSLATVPPVPGSRPRNRLSPGIWGKVVGG